jgi:hypothetical protein
MTAGVGGEASSYAFAAAQLTCWVMPGIEHKSYSSRVRIFSRWTFPGKYSYDLEKFILHFLKTLVDQSSLSLSGSGWFFKRVSLGRFYSSRPSVRSHTHIVSE